MLDSLMLRDSSFHARQTRVKKEFFKIFCTTKKGHQLLNNQYFLEACHKSVTIHRQKYPNRVYSYSDIVKIYTALSRTRIMFGSELTGVPIGRGIYLGTQERRTQVPRSKVRRNIKKKKNRFVRVRITSFPRTLEIHSSNVKG